MLPEVAVALDDAIAVALLQRHRQLPLERLKLPVPFAVVTTAAGRG